MVTYNKEGIIFYYNIETFFTVIPKQKMYLYLNKRHKWLRFLWDVFSNGNIFLFTAKKRNIYSVHFPFM